MATDESEPDAQHGVDETRNWPELVTGVYDRLREDSDGGISIRLRDMELKVPSRTGAEAEQAHWNFDGTIDLNPEDE